VTRIGLAERLRSGANVSLPSDGVTSLDGDKVSTLRKWSLEQMKSEVDFTAMNESFDTLEIAKLRAMMVPEQAFLEGKGGTSSRNVASELGDAFEKSLAVVKAEIDDHINRFMIPQLLAANFGEGGLFGWERVGEVGAGKVHPAGFEFDADRAAVERGGLDQGGADAAKGVDDQPVRWAVLGNQPAGKLRQHLAGVRA